MENTEILSRVIESYLTALGNSTSQDFSIKTFNYILDKHREVYSFLEYLSVGKNPLDESIKIDVENVSELKYAKTSNISDFLEIVFKEVFKEVIQDERFYSTDLESIIQNVKKDVGDLLEELGVRIKWRLVVQGAHAELGVSSAEVTVDITRKKSQILEPLINSIIDLVYEGMLKKEKKRKDAVEVVVEVIKKIEKKYDFFGSMLVEDIDKEQEDYNIKTQWTIEDVFFFNSDDSYAVKAIPRIDEVDDADYAKAMTEFILEVGSYINVQEKPFFIDKLKNFMNQTSLEDFLEIGINLDEIEETFKNQGYNDIIKRTFSALINIIQAKTSTSFAVAALDTIIDSMRNMENASIVDHIIVNKSKYDAGLEAIRINPEINNENPYKIAKFIGYMLKKTQENRKNHSEKVSFINDLKLEMGERYFAELDNMGVNVHIIDMRFI